MIMNPMDIMKTFLLTGQQDSEQMKQTLRNFFIINSWEMVTKHVVPWSIDFVKHQYLERFQQKMSICKKPDKKETILTLERFTGRDNDRIDSVLNFISALPHVRSLLFLRDFYYINFDDLVPIFPHIKCRLRQLRRHTDGTVEQVILDLVTDKDMSYLRDFMDTCHRNHVIKVQNKLGNQMYFFDQYVQHIQQFERSLPKTLLMFTNTQFTTSRTFENMFFEQKTEFEARVKFFMERRDWYDKKGIPYTLGFMLHGPPGCGKTSCIKAIANITNRHIINIHLSDVKTKTQLKRLFYDESLFVIKKSDELSVQNETYTIPINKRLYVIEDIDCSTTSYVLKREIQGILPQKEEEDSDEEFIHPQKPSSSGGDSLCGWQSQFCSPTVQEQHIPQPIERRTNEKKESNKDTIDLSCILNILDGTLEVPGRMLVITTNYPELLDDALIRPGRIDMVVHFNKANRDIMKQMFEFFYEKSCPESALDEIEPYKWTPAEVNQILFRHLHYPEKAIHDLIHGIPCIAMPQQSSIHSDE